MSSQELPDAEALLAELARQMRPAVSANIALVGIRTGGVWIAERLHRELAIAVPLGTLDVSFYRDDYERRGLHANVKPSEIPFDVEGRDLVLVDDVLYTGRTIRAAMNELFDYGRPASIRLAALVDRGGRELPIAAQFVGAALAPGPGESIELVRDDQGRFGLRLYRE
ncbi:MAG TPA: bifunctional pyr operon transcriptional regulator/uracil phosphoribosyltransferase PyrR [Burkholderiales bacterium]